MPESPAPVALALRFFAFSAAATPFYDCTILPKSSASQNVWRLAQRIGARLRCREQVFLQLGQVAR